LPSPEHARSLQARSVERQRESKRRRDRSGPARVRRPRRDPHRGRHGVAAVVTEGSALPDGFVLVADAFDPATSAGHLDGLLAELDWQEQRFTIYGRTTPMPRLIAMYGPVGYRHSGVVHPPRPLPPRLEPIR